MTINKDLLETFGKLFQNRQFDASIHRQSQFLERGSQDAGRGQLRLLQLLRDYPEGLSNTDISIKLDIKPSSVSIMVKHLEHHQFVNRIPNEQDKRSSLVQISESGQAQFDSLEQVSDNIAAKLFNGLSDEEKHQLDALLNKLVDTQEDINWSDMQHQMNHDWHNMHKQNWNGPWDR